MTLHAAAKSRSQLQGPSGGVHPPLPPPPPPPPPRCNNEIKKALKVTQLILFDNGRNHTRSFGGRAGMGGRRGEGEGEGGSFESVK